VLPTLGEVRIVEDVYTELQRWSWARFAPANGCALDELRGALALRLGRAGEAERHFRTGEAWALREGCPVEQGRCILGLAEIADATGAHAESEQLLKDAGRRFRKAGAELYLRDVEALLSPAPELETGHQGEASPIGTLSPREIEVLNLIAVGYTNAQIADELHISTNTVARHVTHILVKTGGANRAEATSYAYRHELITPARNGGQAQE
jgi:DNA-binding CsgD family transcriptional regulator